MSVVSCFLLCMLAKYVFNWEHPVVPLKISTPLRTQTQLDTVKAYSANVRNKKQETTNINVLKLRILTNNFENFKMQKDEIVLNIVTAL